MEHSITLTDNQLKLVIKALRALEPFDENEAGDIEELLMEIVDANSN